VVDYDAWVLFKCNSCWLANGFIELVNKQRQNSLTRIFSFYDNWCHRFWGFHHSIVGNIEVFELFYTTQLQF
jgi:hypothetical protein